MKKLNLLILFGVIVSICFTNCTMEKRLYTSGYHIKWKYLKDNSETSESIQLADKIKSTKINLPKSTDVNEYLTFENDKKDKSPLVASINNSVSKIIKANSESSLYKKLYPIILSSEKECDVMILTNGNESNVKILEINQTEVKYKMCNNLEGPLFIENKSKIREIIYANGTKTIIAETTSSTNNPTEESTENITDPFALTSLISSVFGFLVAGVIFGLGGIVMGIISLSRINKNPKKWKGKGKAIAGIILGIFAFLVWTTLLLIFFLNS